MKFSHIAKFALTLSLLCVPASAEPTEVRPWKSTAGTTVEAAALKVENLKVFLKAADGREFAVPLDKLAEEDQTFL